MTKRIFLKLPYHIIQNAGDLIHVMYTERILFICSQFPHRMTKIKENISKFHSARGGESVPKAIKLAERLAKVNDIRKDSSDLLTVKLNSQQDLQPILNAADSDQTSQGDVESTQLGDYAVQSNSEESSNDCSDIEVVFDEAENVSKPDECNNNCHDQKVLLDGSNIVGTKNIPEVE